MDRGDAVDEATFAAMQAVLSLMRAGDGRDLDRLRDALGSARAAVVAAGYALTTSADAERMQKSAARRT